MIVLALKAVILTTIGVKHAQWRTEACQSYESFKLSTYDQTSVVIKDQNYWLNKLKIT